MKNKITKSIIATREYTKATKEMMEEIILLTEAIKALTSLIQDILNNLGVHIKQKHFISNKVIPN